MIDPRDLNAIFLLCAFVVAVVVCQRHTGLVRAVREGEPKHRPLLAVVTVAHPALASQGSDAADQREQTQPRTSRTALRLLERLEDDLFVCV